MKARLSIPLVEMVLCLSDAVDMISRKVASHHRRVAFIAHSIAAEAGLSEKTANDILLSGLVHDVGALTLKDRLNTLQFEEAPGDHHSELGHALLDTFSPFAGIAQIVRFHHVPWKDGRGATSRGEKVPVGSHIVHLADRISVLIDDESEILGQAGKICAKIKRNTPSRFEPDMVDAFVELSDREYFWLDVVSPTLDSRIHDLASPVNVMLEKDGITELTTLFGRVVDFRSRYTAVHTSGVAATAGKLAEISGMSPVQQWMMSIAGNLHDLGKLSVPVEIIEKPGKLNEEEYNIMKRHTFYTYRLLERLKGMEEINAWASFHHERMDGHGYPFNRGGVALPPGSRMMAVADVFTALSETRPYREGMDKKDVVRVMDRMAKLGALDPEVYLALLDNIDEVGQVRAAAQDEAASRYAEFRDELEAAA